MAECPKPEELFLTKHTPPSTGWMDPKVKIKKGLYGYAAIPKSVEYLGLPYARPWNPLDEDWKLPENWQEIIYNGFKDRLERYNVRTF